jgi:hypothetical protein
MQAAQRERRLDTVESSRLSREHEDE